MSKTNMGNMILKLVAHMAGIGLLVAAATFSAYAAEVIKPNIGEPLRDRAVTRLQPLFDTPLRDTSICKGGDGAWYLTGTMASRQNQTDFQTNDGIWLWKSTDLKTWSPLGQVWSIEKQGTAWQKEYRVNPDNPTGPLVRGMVSPEIHFQKNTYWITYSMNAQGTGLLRSQSGKPEGPYEDLGRFTGQGTDASLFVDDDGTGYWLVGQGWLAKLKPDWTGLAEHPQLLRCEPFPTNPVGAHSMSATHAPRYLGAAGAHLFKKDGKYFLIGASVRDRIGVGCYDTFVAFADKITGPYSSPLLMIPHGGQTTVFKGPDDKWWATFSGRDSRAVFRDKPAMVPLEFANDVQYGRATKVPYPRKPRAIVTEFGPWDKVPLVQPYHIRDLQFTLAPDGYYYLTGSGCDPAFSGKIMLYRSKDLRQWEIVDVQFDYVKQVPGATLEDYEIRFGEKRNKGGLGQYYMDSEVYYLAGTFHLFTSLYGTKSGGREPAGGAMWLRSTTGKPEGPYEYVDRARSQSSVFVEGDKTYLFYNGTLMEFDPKGHKLDGPTMRLRTTMGTMFTKGDVATNLLKVHGKYVVFGTGWCGGTYGENYRVDGTYDWVYWQSDKLEGPYDMPRRAYAMPHCGHSCPPLQGKDGRWYGLFFGNDSTGPWNAYPGVLVFDVRLDPDDTIRIELKDELP